MQLREPSILLIILFVNVKAEFIAGPEPVLNLTEVESQSYVLYMNENNHNFTNSTLLFSITGETSVSTPIPISSNTFRNSLEQQDGIYYFYALQFFDYETQARTYTFEFSPITVTINILNIDDESPSLTSTNCKLKENFMYDTSNTTCNCTVSDPDGWLSEITFTIPDDSAGSNGIFTFEYKDTPSDTTYEAEVYIVLNKTLDYEDITFYSFVVVAQDGAGHGTTPTEVRMFVNVEDQNDMPPEWVVYFTTAQFEEEQNQTFHVKAVDGDKGINAPIHYKLVKDEEEKCVSIDNGIISVEPIDRDARDIQTYLFTIMAIEDDEPSYNITLDITFYVDDIDDNSPLVVSTAALNGADNQTFSEDDEKIILFNFDENYDGTLDANIAIRDIDTGVNAQFTVQLIDLDDGISYSEAFLVVPTAGYRQSSFQIIVRNSTKLDYEDPDWINIQFYVLSQGNDVAREDKILVNITLNDINDEYPIFAKSEYTATIKETLPIDELIVQVLATDKDAEDKILEHSLIGSTVATSLLRIDSETGKIFVAIADAFDYDTINPIFVQVRATDKVGHTATVPLTIALTDVNNKAPSINVATAIGVDENQAINSVLNTSITATDPDTTRNLTAQINWDTSYAMKNSRRLDMTTETIRQQVMFLDLHFEDAATKGDININLVVNENNEEFTTPDFELFDSLFLYITVTDLNTDPAFIYNQNTTALIMIGIGDLNDNKPIFTEESINANRTVYEDASSNIIVGSILAIDADVGDTVTYDCIAQNEQFDWVTVDSSSGVLTVKPNVVINADVPPTYTFNYTCSASDGDENHNTYLNISLYIIDRNNRIPSINVNSIISLEEKSDQGTNVTNIETPDLDRDIPFHAVRCEFDTESTSCSNMFVITNNEVLVGSNVLDRDRGQDTYKCGIICYDNPDRLQNQDQTRNTSSFTIILLDINDNTPELVTKYIEGRENIQEGALIGIILATDIDLGENADIDFHIESVTKVGDEETNFSGLFDVETDEDYLVNKTFKQANLLAKQDLRDNYGSYIINFMLSDRGNTPNIGYYDLNLEITRFNYYAPKFVFPVEDSQTFILQAYQQIGSQMYQFHNNSLFPNISAVDNEDDQCSGKWNMTFRVEQVEPSDVSIFSISTNGFDECTGGLQVNNYYNKDTVTNNIYQVLISAILSDDTPEENEESYITTRSMTVSFLDATTDPIFTNNNWNFSFYEATLPQDKELEDRAMYQNVPENEQPSIYYFLVTKTVEKIFNVDPESGTVSLQQELDYLTNQKYEFNIVASKNTEASSSDERSYLSVTVDVIDVNNHVPQWTRDQFYGAIMSSYPRNTPILTATATDADEIDKDHLTYGIVKSTLTTNGTGLDGLSSPFIMDEISGEIKLNFQVDSIMSGHFNFDIQVQDQVDELGNGPFVNVTSVTIFIITTDNTVNFRFENTLEQVVQRENYMLEKIGNTLGYSCSKQNIAKDTANGVELNNQTVASLYFLSNSSVIKSEIILREVSNINTFTTLKNSLLENGLLLMSFATEEQSGNLEYLLKAWLIGVSVVLGAICVILLVTFILKTRELNRRINKLTMNKFGSEESGLNRLGINAPTTNKHAVEGSNPVFNSEVIKSDLENFDKTSIRSGDSDLIGVEDNPEFDYFDSNNKINSGYI